MELTLTALVFNSCILLLLCRSFGFLPKRGSFLGKRKVTPKATPPKPWRPFTFYIYLMNLNSDSTPTPEEEFKLAQAGLGKRLINMSHDMNHDQV